MPKRKCTKKQLAALAKGRKTRAANIRKGKRKKSTKKKTPVKRKRSMAKRRRTGDDLTGGTGDVNPQYYGGQIGQTVNDNIRNLAFASPVNRIGNVGYGQRKAVMEILKVWCELPPILFTNDEVNHRRIVFSLGTKDAGNENVELDAPQIICFFEASTINAFTAAGTLWNAQQDVMVWDCTDGCGHGVLVATDYIWAQIRSAGTDAQNTAHFKILYRFKNVGLTEYIGIVQSQQ